jgi:ATP-dependent DNA helicase RecG
MTIDEIISRKEDQTFDCKSIQIDPKALAVPIVAMANADGGVLAIGVSDKTRRIEGVNQHTGRLNELLRVPMDFCVPSVRVQWSFLPCVDSEGNDNRILLMQVPASSHLHTNQADEAFMRVGDKSRKLGFDERMQLMYDKGERNYEDEAAYGATIDDVDMVAVNEYIKVIGYGKSAMEYLHENNDFVKEADGKQKVSNACILLFGKKPQRFFPRARTRFIRYEGTEEKVGTEMNVVKDVTFEGTILTQIQKTVEYLETQVREHSFLGQNGQFVTNRNYPKFAIQEMVVNSECHRDYSIKGTEIQIKMFDDRLVFESPGKLPGLVRAENIRHTHFSRNPKIAQFLKAYNYVKEFGEGIDRICNELESRGATIPYFHTDAFILKATLKAEFVDDGTQIFKNVPQNKEFGEMIGETDGEMKLTERQQYIYNEIKKTPSHTAKSLARYTKLSERTVEREISYLRNNGFIDKKGKANNSDWVILK